MLLSEPEKSMGQSGANQHGTGKSIKRHARSLGNENSPGNSVCLAEGKQPELTALLENCPTISFGPKLAVVVVCCCITTHHPPPPPPPPPPTTTTTTTTTAVTSSYPQPHHPPTQALNIAGMPWHFQHSKTALHHGNWQRWILGSEIPNNFPSGLSQWCQASRKESIKPERWCQGWKVHMSANELTLMQKSSFWSRKNPMILLNPRN